jgi:hypothetical protein
MIISTMAIWPVVSGSTVPITRPRQEDGSPVGDVDHLIDVVADQDDREAIVAEVADELQDAVGFFRPQCCCRLVR